jgi:hypothetical protein
MLLGSCRVLLLVGISIQIYDTTKITRFWAPGVVTVLCITTSLVFALTTYFLHWVALYWVVNAALVPNKDVYNL